MLAKVFKSLFSNHTMPPYDKGTRCLVLHTTAQNETEIYGRVVSESVADHVGACKKYRLGKDGRVHLNTHFNEMRFGEPDLSRPREGDTEALGYELDPTLGEPAGARSTTILHCSNAPSGMNNQHDWQYDLSGAGYCINCGLKRVKR